MGKKTAENYAVPKKISIFTLISNSSQVESLLLKMTDDMSTITVVQ